MIKYNLNCEECNKYFDSWFSTSSEFDKIKRMKLLTCPFCNSKKIKKSLMAPNLANTKKRNNLYQDKKFIDTKNKLKKYKKFIKKNFQYVGENFTYEARSIHYNKIKKKRGIYGKASLKDVKELKEEGIDTQMIPWIEDKEN